MSQTEQNKDKQIGWIVSLSIHALVVLLFFFVMAWRAPDPPLPEYGIELNFGLDAGFGNDQPTVTPTPPTEDDEGEPEEQIEEVQEEVIEEPQEAEPIEESAIEELPDSQQEDSPVETQPAEEQTPVDQPVEEEIVEKAKPISEPVIKTPEEEPKVEEKVINPQATYPGSSSQGNKEDVAGDVGDPERSEDARAIYGKSGEGEGGPRLELAGWEIDGKLNVNDNSKENGFIIFEIKVDDNGDVIGVRTLEKTVSVGVERLYKSEVEKLTLRQTGNAIAAPISKGRITFTITSQ